MPHVVYSHVINEDVPQVSTLSLTFQGVNLPKNTAAIVNELMEELRYEVSRQYLSPSGHVRGIYGCVITHSDPSSIVVVYDNTALPSWEEWYRQLAMQIQVMMESEIRPRKPIVRWSLKPMASS